MFTGAFQHDGRTHYWPLLAVNSLCKTCITSQLTTGTPKYVKYPFENAWGLTAFPPCVPLSVFLAKDIKWHFEVTLWHHTITYDSIWHDIIKVNPSTKICSERQTDGQTHAQTVVILYLRWLTQEGMIQRPWILKLIQSSREFLKCSYKVYNFNSNL